MSEEAANNSTPPPPSWLDENLIQTALRRGDDDPTITVLSCDFSKANAQGDGYLSNMYRAVAKLQGGQERRLVIKCQPQGGLQEELVKALSAYERETRMFSETLPAMQKLVEKIGVYQPISAKCLLHGTDPIPYIVLEDLRLAGFTLADRTKGLDLDHCKLVVRTQALFHASSCAYFEQNPTSLDYFKQSAYTEEFGKQLQPFIENSIKSIKENILTWAGYEKYAEKLENAGKNLFAQVRQASQYKEGKFNTLLHADTWTNNIMFKYTNGTVTDVRLVDFQASFYSSPTIDLQTFITSCSQENVRDHIDSLLKEYHETLTQTLNKLEYKARIITFDELKKDFVEHSVFGLLSSCTILPVVMSEKTKVLEIEDVFKSSEGFVNSIQEVSDSRVYQRIMKKLLVHYEKLGLL